jgi:hypothetical protein
MAPKHVSEKNMTCRCRFADPTRFVSDGQHFDGLVEKEGVRDFSLRVDWVRGGVSGWDVHKVEGRPVGVK